jgi:phenylalanyl-tRNA synthetase beta chain
MKLPLSQLKEYLPLSLTPEEIAEHLTLAGMEVEKIENKNFGFSDIVVAEVQETIPHPNADNLKIATVTDGKETLTIVCGASNCRAGMKTALAKNGSSLKDRNGKIWKIKKTRLRGVESEGMLCSAIELGLSLEGEGILDLPSTTHF